MPLSRDVVSDLWVLYRSGEASADTVGLVEAFLKDDPEFEQLIRRAEKEEPVAPTVGPAPEVMMRALNETRRRLRTQRVLMGLAIFFTLVPFSFVFSTERGLVWMFLRDTSPINSLVYLGVGATLWIAYYATSRTVRRAGL